MNKKKFTQTFKNHLKVFPRESKNPQIPNQLIYEIFSVRCFFRRDSGMVLFSEGEKERWKRSEEEIRGRQMCLERRGNQEGGRASLYSPALIIQSEGASPSRVRSTNLQLQQQYQKISNTDPGWMIFSTKTDHLKSKNSFRKDEH